MRAVLLGMNNPLSADPRYALAPFPSGSSGYRLWRLLQTRQPQVTRKGYMDGFERMNLLNSRTWSRSAAKAAAENFPSLYAGRTIVVFGEQVRSALELPKMLIHPVQMNGCTWRQLPHPSGLCRWYNDPECAGLAAILLEELYLKGQPHAEEIRRDDSET